ncbi:3-deoxy-manno-octulosonate cytidylyltransferase [Rhizobium albus]|nr:3-deoxy-manno-octulosonate cytidylyltransferase [Rhizobium albus]
MNSRGTYVFCTGLATLFVAARLRLFDTFSPFPAWEIMTTQDAGETIVLIPARMASTRLPGKPLAPIAGLPMIVQVAMRAMEANIGPVAVCADTDDVREAVEAAGFRFIMTGTQHQSGSDRIAEALQTLDPEGRIKRIVNLQGDLPTVDPESLAAALRPLDDPAVDIATLAVEITEDDERSNPNVVKVVGTEIAPNRLRALYFTRATAPHGDGPLYHHVGLYAYRREALTRFVALGPSPLELREKLEQLRALEAGMRIDVEIVDTVPLGVDTPADLAKARRLLAKD